MPHYVVYVLSWLISWLRESEKPNDKLKITALRKLQKIHEFLVAVFFIDHKLFKVQVWYMDFFFANGFFHFVCLFYSCSLLFETHAHKLSDEERERERFFFDIIENFCEMLTIHNSYLCYAIYLGIYTLIRALSLISLLLTGHFYGLRCCYCG